ncbi:ABC transporter permease [Microbacterium pseudoresistens]|uniref:Ribose transport system permease protein n=1 Tax=Microbacterium pseudoresistens TaxID=640634 RepID=A0A7Y9EUH8_9MICO|nr:ABC transporter permease [Microbacterium pseudoresistens]NYD54180.1 ribose transport system permease protein [Microbacterium pseudoresistens]
MSIGETTKTETTHAPSRRFALPRVLGSATDITLVLVLIVAVFATLNFRSFFTAQNFTQILINAALLLVMAVGATFVLITGGVDLSVGSVLVFSGVIAAKVMEWFGSAGWGASIAGIVAALIAGIAWGCVNGLVITKLRVPPLITTLGSYGAAQGLAQIITNGNDLKNVPMELVDSVGFGRVIGIPILVIIAVAVALIGGLVLWATRFGRHTYAVGSNAEAARRAGVNVDRHLLKVYAIAGMLAGVAGILSYAKFGTTTLAGHATDNLNVIAAVVIGGTSLFGGIGTMIGTVVGTLIPATLANGLVIVGLNSFWRDFAVGVVLVAAVYLDQLRRRSRSPRR